MGLSPKQADIVKATGKVVVDACPGSGKTYCVAARIAHLLKAKKFRRQGIAAISFTNVAWREISDELEKSFGISTPLPFPHFLGTIDSFMNQYVFLPFGHLVMECQRRPELVGGNLSNWTYFSGNKKAAFYPYFDRFSFGKNGELIQIRNTLDTFFKGGWSRLSKPIAESKYDLFKKGYANQDDANYFAYKILCKYPKLAQAIVKRFPDFIIDEAQDTTDVQMAIVDKLVGDGGLQQVLLIGDPDQAIFEWNNARPELFKSKYQVEGWNHVPLNENRRNSQLICNLANAFVGKEKSIVHEDNEAKDDTFEPLILEYDEADRKSVLKVRDDFLLMCSGRSIRSTSSDPQEAKIAVVYRSKSFGKHFGFPAMRSEEVPWYPNKYHVRDLVQGKFLFERGELRKGYKLIEQGYLKAITGQAFMSSEAIQKKVDERGFRVHRDELFSFMDRLPVCGSKNLAVWLSEASKEFPQLDLKTNSSKSNTPILSMFNSAREEVNELSYHIGTVHSVKGCTFDALLLFAEKRAGRYSAYKKLFVSEQLRPEEEEELRIVYVAITRPRRVLVIAVPKGEKETWWNKLGMRKFSANGQQSFPESVLGIASKKRKRKKVNQDGGK